MVSWSTGRRWLDALEADLRQIQRVDERIDGANRIVLINPIVEALRQKRRLSPIRAFDEPLHPRPRKSPVES
jgi:hypothetical protein